MSASAWENKSDTKEDKARSRQSGGTGLGLSIAKEIVDLHQGRLYLVDKDGPGLTIRMELPVDGPAPEGGRP